MKKRKILLCSIFLMGVFFQPVSALAGDINGNEQGVLDYVSGAVFEYEGVSYVAKVGYINQLRAKFMEDGIDLTQKEANNAIMQINANVKTGVTDGYLQPMSDSGGTEPATTPSGEASPGENGQGETGQIETGQGETGQGESGKSGNNTIEESKNPKEDKNGSSGNGKLSEGQQESTEETLQNQGNNIENDPEQQIGNSKEGAEGQPLGENSSGNLTDGKNIETFVQEVLSQNTEAVNISVEQDSNNGSSVVTVEQYLPGKMTLVSMDGEVLFQGSLPIKNTGYQTNEKTIALFAVFYCGLLVVMIKRKECVEIKDET